MNEEEIRRIVRDEVKDLLSDAKLSEKDILVNLDGVYTKGQLKGAEIHYLKKVKDIAICIGKKGGEIICIIAFVLGLWDETRVIAQLLFQKDLPEAVQLAKMVHKNDEIHYSSPNSSYNPDENEKLIVVNQTWESLTKPEYNRIARDFLSGERPPDKLFEENTIFIATSGIVADAVVNSTSSYEEFV